MAQNGERLHCAEGKAVKPQFTSLSLALSLSASSPVLVNPPRNMSALDGKDATIPCEAEGAPSPNVTWFFNGKPPSSTKKFGVICTYFCWSFIWHIQHVNIVNTF